MASFKEKGLLLYRTLPAPDASYVEFKKLDTALNEQWKGAVALERNLSFFKAKTKEGFLVLLYWNRLSVVKNFRALIVNESKGSYAIYDINNAIPFSPTEFDVTNNSLLIGGYYNFRPIVLHYGFASKNTKVLPGYFNEPGELTQIKTYFDGSFDVIVRVKNAEKRKSLRVKNYDSEANLKSAVTLNSERTRNFIHGKSIKLSDGTQLIAGTYGRNTEYSQGIFCAVADSTGKSEVNYYSHADLKNFFAFMNLRREGRIKDRIQRRKAKGKNIKFNYRFLVHDLIRDGNKLLLVAESYFPRYSYPTYSSRTFFVPSIGLSPYLNSNPTYRGDYVFDGYQYTHAIVVAFDKKGQLLWDNSFEINDIKNMQLEQFVTVLPENTTTKLAYLFENTVRTKTIQDSLVLTPKESSMIQLSSNEDETPRKDGEANALTNWYDDYLVGSGVQRLRNKKQGRYGVERRVFYITKIELTGVK